jgi:hypothetical protein
LGVREEGGSRGRRENGKGGGRRRKRRGGEKEGEGGIRGKEERRENLLSIPNREVTILVLYPKS